MENNTQISEKREIEPTMSRMDFLKKSAVGLLGLLFVAKSSVDTSYAASVRDNLNGGGGGVSIGTTAPSNKNKLWVDTSKSSRGVMKYWNGFQWSATASVWDE